MASSLVPIYSLPNEVLIQVLSSFPTRKLLPLASVSRRFAGVVGRLHYSRLHEAALLQDHEMILECYHPSVKISTPTLFCEYLGTEGLEEAGERVRFGEMNALYTRFRPYLGDEHMRPRARYPTRRMAEGGAEAQLIAESPTQDIHLDTGERFSQLCTVASLIKVGPRRGLFLSIAQVTDEVIRVFRTWLESQAAQSQGYAQKQRVESSIDEDESILWANAEKDVGVKFRVAEKHNLHAPVFVDANEEPPASYVLHYEELLVRTNRLLLSHETSLAQQVNPSADRKALMNIEVWEKVLSSTPPLRRLT